MLEAIERIERYAVRGREAFDSDELIASWIVRHIELIGEAARALPGDVRNCAPGVPWREIAGMRNVLVHDCFDIDADIVWRVVERDLPVVKPKLERLLVDLEARERDA